MSAITPVVKKAATLKAKPARPTFAVMIAEAITQLSERSGSSKQAIQKFIAANHNIDFDNKLLNKHYKLALCSGVKAGNLKQVKGTGANGSFKVSEQAKAAEKTAAKVKAQKEKKAVASAKPVIKKAKSSDAKKNVAQKKVSATKKVVAVKPVAEEKASKKVNKPPVVKKSPAKKEVVKKASSVKTTKKAPAKSIKK